MINCLPSSKGIGRFGGNHYHLALQLHGLMSFPDTTHYWLLGFCDASDKGFAAVVYARIDSADNFAVEFASKTKLAPLSCSTTPRLELFGMLILSRLILNVYKCFSERWEGIRMQLWTDSLINLQRAKNVTREYKPFVEKRLREIRNVDPSLWNFVQTDQNPADIPSRGATAQEIESSLFWRKGPEFIREPTFDPSQFANETESHLNVFKSLFQAKMSTAHSPRKSLRWLPTHTTAIFLVLHAYCLSLTLSFLGARSRSDRLTCPR